MHPNYTTNHCVFVWLATNRILSCLGGFFLKSDEFLFLIVFFIFCRRSFLYNAAVASRFSKLGSQILEGVVYSFGDSILYFCLCYCNLQSSNNTVSNTEYRDRLTSIDLCVVNCICCHCCPSLLLLWVGEEIYFTN